MKRKWYTWLKNGLVDKSVISSFDHKTLHQVRKYNPDLKLAYLTRKWDQDFLDKAKELKPTYIHIRLDILSKDRVLQLKQAGYKINTWTLNQPSEIDRAINLGVDGIVTDQLELAQTRLNSSKNM